MSKKRVQDESLGSMPREEGRRRRSRRGDKSKGNREKIKTMQEKKKKTKNHLFQSSIGNYQ